MQRLVYSPKVWAYVQRGTPGPYADQMYNPDHIIDLTQYIVSGSVTRRLNAVSSAELVIRNPDRKWTEPRGNPAFRPMDPITIYMMRRPGYPVQVFTGYLDSVPYLALYPGVVTLHASCTLKRLLHTYFDPALPYTVQWLGKYGWVPKGGSMVNDGSGGTGGSAGAGGVGYPLGKKATLGGSPEDHRTGGRGGPPWENDGWDLMVPVGTKALACGNGTVTKVVMGSTALTEGWQIHLKLDNGREFFYNLHGGGVKKCHAGQKVKRGDVLGLTGDTNGPHLHFSSKDGNYDVLNLDGEQDRQDPPPEKDEDEDDVTSMKALHDPGFGNLLFGTLKDIGRWHGNTVYIEQLPTGIGDRAEKWFHEFKDESKESREAVKDMLSRIIGTDSYGGDSGGGDNGADPSITGGPNVEKAFNYLRDMGYSEDQAAGAVGSMMQESGRSLNPKALNSSSGAYGIAQWLGNRKSGLTSRPRHNTIETQLKYLRYELLNSERASHDKMKNANSLEEATEIWTIYFERPGVHERVLPTRIGFAKFVRDKYAGANDGQSDKPKDDKARKAARVENDAEAGGDDEKGLTSPVKGLKAGSVGGGGGSYGAPRGYPGGHAGVDAPAAFGSDWCAITDGTITATTGSWYQGSGCVVLKPSVKVKGYPDGIRLGYGGTSEILVKTGQKVKAGDVIAKGGTHGSGPHLHFFVRTDDSPANGTMDPTPLLKAAADGKQPDGDVANESGDEGGGGGSGSSGGDNPRAAAFAAQFAWPSLMEATEALALSGRKSYMNDKPLLPFVEQLCSASLRMFQSMPDGDFFAFYPDYFGELGHNEPYWSIEDVEILDGTIDFNDDETVTHQYVVGETVPFLGDQMFNKLNSSGVVTVFEMWDSAGEGKDSQLGKYIGSRMPGPDGKIPKPLKGREAALAFLGRYGVRPALEEAPMIRSPFYELFLAWQRFMQAWAAQFKTEFTFTFMPELYPGGKVSFPNHGIKCFIQEVTHSFDYESGFTTSAVLSAPSVYPSSKKKSVALQI